MRRLLAILTIVCLLALPALSVVFQPLAAFAGPQQPANLRLQPMPSSGRAAGQKSDRQRESKGVFRAFVNLVLIDVQVTDAAGKPVKGLKSEQFSVLEDDKPQKISSFDYYDIEAIEAAAAKNPTPVVVALGAVGAPEKVQKIVRGHRMLVLFFDMTSLEPDELLRSTDAARRFLLEQMKPADLVAVVAFGNQLHVMANFTNNRGLLQNVVARLLPGAESELAGMAEAGPAEDEESVSEDAGAAFTPDETEFNIFNTDRKLAAVEALADLLRDIPGKKSVIHFSGGITQTGEENRSQLRAATDAANSANVSFYTVDSRGLLAMVPGGPANTAAAAGRAMFSGAAVFHQIQSRHTSRETLATLASDTGGRAFFDSGDFREVFHKVQADAAGYYLVGYYSTNAQRDGRWRRVKVRVEAPSTRIRYREGYYAPKDYGLFNTEDRERQLEEAMLAETPRVELPLALETPHFHMGQDEVFVPIAAKLPSSALQWAEKQGRRVAEFDFAAEVREEPSGRVAGALRDTIKVRLDTERFEQMQQRALVYQGGLILRPGSYRLKFLVRENETGRIGTFEQTLALPPLQPEDLELSSVLLSSQLEPARKTPEVEKKALAADAKLKASPLEVSGELIVPSVTHVFTTQQRLHIFFQAYLPPKADGSKLRAALVFFRNGERTMATPLVEPVQVDLTTQTRTFLISLALEKFAPGRYTIQAVAVEAGGEHVAFARSYFALRPPAQLATVPFTRDQ